MAALGEKLRREREARGVSLREIAVATRIHENYLRALEENDYGALPGAVFVTGFLRNYATHLGLDADKIVAEFEAMKIEPPVERNLVPGVIDDVEESSLSTLWVVGSLVLILVIYVAYVNWPGSAPEQSKPEIDIVAEKAEKPPPDKIEPIEPKAETEAAVPDADKAEQPPVARPPVARPPVARPPVGTEQAAVVKADDTPKAVAEVKKKPPPPAVTKKEPATAAVVKNKVAATVEPEKKKKAVLKQTAVAAPEKAYKYRLVVKARDEDAWILVVVDNAIERDMFVRAGQRVVIKGNDSFNFTTGNASQISLTLNGKPLKFEIPPDNVVRGWEVPLPEAE